MKKTILLFITLLFSVVTLLHAQTAEKGYTNFYAGGLTNEDFFTKSDLVVESRYIGIVAIYDTKGNRNSNDIYSILAVKIHRVYKGDKSLEGDTVYIVSKGGTLGTESVYLHDNSANLKEGEVAVETIEEIQYGHAPPLLKNNDCRYCNVSDYVPHIHFFRVSDFPDIKDSKYSPYKKYKFFYTSGTKLYICGDKILGLNNLIFQNRREFYNYIKQFEEFMIPKVEERIETAKE